MSLVVTYYGQGSLCLKSTELQSAAPVRIVIDPAPSVPAASLPAYADANADAGFPSPHDQSDADYILQTQVSGDQLHATLDCARRSEATVLCHSELASWFTQQGIQNVHSLTLGSGVNLPFGKVIMTLAHQGGASADSTPDLSAAGAPAMGAPVSYLIHFNDGLDVYVAGNSAQTADMELIGKAGGVDLAILPLGNQPYNGSDDALRAAQLVQAKHVLPLRRSVRANAQALDEGTVLAERLRRVAEIDATVLQPGEEAVF